MLATEVKQGNHGLYETDGQLEASKAKCGFHVRSVTLSGDGDTPDVKLDGWKRGRVEKLDRDDSSRKPFCVCAAPNERAPVPALSDCSSADCGTKCQAAFG